MPSECLTRGIYFSVPVFTFHVLAFGVNKKSLIFFFNGKPLFPTFSYQLATSFSPPPQTVYCDSCLFLKTASAYTWNSVFFPYSLYVFDRPKTSPRNLTFWRTKKKNMSLSRHKHTVVGFDSACLIIVCFLEQEQELQQKKKTKKNRRRVTKARS